MTAKKANGTDTKLAVMANDIAYIKDEVKDIKQKLEGQYVTQDEFEPIKKIVYGLVTLILTAVVMGLIGLVLKK